MVQFDNRYRQIKVKIVYYGPALGGKTTCLRYIHSVVDPERRTKLYALNTANDRTIFFDLMALDLGRIRGFKLTLQLFTVPGQVQYNATRRAVLAGADGVVFVADSQVSQRSANLESLENLKENLIANGLDPEKIPLVFQYNKRDLSPLIPIEEMEAELNKRKAPAFASVATVGEGVMEAFAAAAESTLASVADKLGLGTSTQAVERLKAQARKALEPFLKAKPKKVAADDLVSSSVPVKSHGPLPQEELVKEAVKANVAMTDMNIRLDATQKQLERKVKMLSAITEFGSKVALLRKPSEVLRALLETAAEGLGAEAGAVMTVTEGPLKEVARLGLVADPLMATRDGVGQPLALTILEEGSPVLFSRELGGEPTEHEMALEALEKAGFGSGLAVPLAVREETIGLFTAYRREGRRPLDEDDLQLASVLGTTAAIAFDNSRGWQRLERLNRELEAEVAARTRELKEKHVLLESAYKELEKLDQVKGELISRISKELKAPVTSLVTAAKILRGYKETIPEKTEKFLQIVEQEAEKLADMIDSATQGALLAEPGNLKLEKIKVEELLKRAIAPLRDLAKTRKVKLSVRIPATLGEIECDRRATEAALKAVIKNAIEFNQTGGEVLVELRRSSGGAVNITIKDSGMGIPENELPHVFEPFWQGSNVLTEKPRGLGLGLAIAKKAMEAQGGSVSVESEMGEGTVVTMELPQPPRIAA